MIELIEDITKIATPDAATALVAFLWHTNESLRFSAAWSLAELFTQNDITEALQEIELTAEQRNANYLDWIWQPFNDSSNPSLSIIAGRIVYLLDNTSTESIPRPLPQLDPRLIIPLLSIHDAVDFQGDNRWNSLADSLLAEQEQTSEIEQKIIRQVNHILGIQFSLSRWAIILSSLKPRLQLDLLHRLINQRSPTHNDWRNLFLEIKYYQFQHSYHYRLVLAVGLIASIVAMLEMILLVFRQPDNWLNGFLGLAIYLISVFWISLWQGIEESLEPKTFIQFGLLGIFTFGTEIQRLFKDRLVWSKISLFDKSVAVAFAVAPVAFAFAVVAIAFAFAVGAPVGPVGPVAVAVAVAVAGAGDGAVGAGVFASAVAGALIGMGLGFWYRAKSQTDWMRFLAIFAFPYFCWFPIVVVFSTLFMWDYLNLPWQYTVIIWLILLGTCTGLWIYGQNKERRASNPLKGILDVTK